MTLKIVNNDSVKEVHSVRIEDGIVTIISIEDGSKVQIKEMENIFPNFKMIVDEAIDTANLLAALQATNDQYIWAHVSGKL